MPICDAAPPVLAAEKPDPVVELARALAAWIELHGSKGFAFDSMSYEEVGALTMRDVWEGWVFGSVFEPTTASRPVPFPEVERCTRAFVDRVVADLVACGLDPAVVGR